MHTRRRFFALSSMTALGAVLLPAAGAAKSSAGLESDNLPVVALPATELENEFQRYLTGAATGQCEGARQMCIADKESSHG